MASASTPKAPVMVSYVGEDGKEQKARGGTPADNGAHLGPYANAANAHTHLALCCIARQPPARPGLHHRSTGRGRRADEAIAKSAPCLAWALPPWWICAPKRSTTWPSLSGWASTSSTCPPADWRPSTQEDLETGSDWVLHELESAGDSKVLIHCQHGMGRSVILAGAVLLKMGYDWQEALRLIKSKRLGVGPLAARSLPWPSLPRSKKTESS